MYCSKCGKQIDYDAEVCNECAEQEVAARDSEPTPTENQPTGSRKEGFGRSLASTILGAVGFILSMLAITFAILAAGNLLIEYSESLGVAVPIEAYELLGESATFITLAIVFSIFTLGVSIPGMIFGIKSMKVFFKAKREGKVKPIATLVLGICGMVASICAIAFVQLTLLLCLIV